MKIQKNVENKRYIILFLIYLGFAFYCVCKIHPNMTELIKIEKVNINLWESVKQIGRLDKILDNVYNRLVYEIALYIPVGIIGCLAFCKRKYYIVLVVLVSDFFLAAIKIKWMMIIYIGQIIIHNIMGTLTGISLYYFVSYLKRRKRLRNMMLCMVVPFVVLIYVSFQYICSCTNFWGSVYKKSDINRLSDELQIDCKEGELGYILREHKGCMYAYFTQQELNDLEKKLFNSVGISEYRTYIEENNTITQLPAGTICRKSIDSDGRYIFVVDRNQPRSDIVFIDMERYKEIKSQETSKRNARKRIDFSSEEVKHIKDILYSKLGIDIYLNENMIVYINDCTKNIQFEQYIQIAKDVYDFKSYEVNIDEQGNIMYFSIYDRVDYGWENIKMYKDNSWFAKLYKASDTNVISTEEAYQKLCNGGGFIEDFDGDIGVNEVVVTDADIDICEDDKGYLEYVYVFYIEPIYTEDGTLIDRIYVPAMKSYY